MLDSLPNPTAGTVLGISLVLYLATYLLQRLIVFHLWDRRPTSHTPPVSVEILVGFEVVALALTTVLMPICLLTAGVSLAVFIG